MSNLLQINQSVNCQIDVISGGIPMDVGTTPEEIAAHFIVDDVSVNGLTASNNVDFDPSLFSITKGPNDGLGQYTGVYKVNDYQRELVAGEKLKIVVRIIVADAEPIIWSREFYVIPVHDVTTNTELLDRLNAIDKRISNLNPPDEVIPELPDPETDSSQSLSQLFLDTLAPRISGRTGQLIDLNVNFFNNGQLSDPFSIDRVEIYRCSVAKQNLVATIPFACKDEEIYPAPAYREKVYGEIGLCGTQPPVNGEVRPGIYHLPFKIPKNIPAPEVYIDVWYFHPINPCDCPENFDSPRDALDCNPCDPKWDHLLTRCCHRFWVYPDEWMCNDGLQEVNFGFEPLNVRFNRPETKCLEVGLMPLPLYSYNKNLVDPMIPFLKPSISIGTSSGGACDMLVKDDEMDFGFRQGPHRTNPWVIKYRLETEKFMRGSYWYQTKLNMPDGTSRVSRRFYFEIR